MNGSKELMKWERMLFESKEQREVKRKLARVKWRKFRCSMLGILARLQIVEIQSQVLLCLFLFLWLFFLVSLLWRKFREFS